MMYSFVFIAMIDCWNFLVYKRSILDILLSIVIFNVDEKVVQTTLQTNSPINIYYTKILMINNLFCMIGIVLSIFIYFIHHRNVFTDLKKTTRFDLKKTDSLALITFSKVDSSRQNSTRSITTVYQEVEENIIPNVDTESVGDTEDNDIISVNDDDDSSDDNENIRHDNSNNKQTTD